MALVSRGRGVGGRALPLFSEFTKQKSSIWKISKKCVSGLPSNFKMLTRVLYLDTISGFVLNKMGMAI